jgi:hypothetical protein
MFTVALLILLLIIIGWLTYKIDEIYALEKARVFDNLELSQQKALYMSILGLLVVAFFVIIAFKIKDVRNLVRGFVPRSQYIMV